MSASVRVTLEDESYTTNDVPETTAQNWNVHSKSGHTSAGTSTNKY
jgi:hypothetical protein